MSQWGEGKKLAERKTTLGWFAQSFTVEWWKMSGNSVFLLYYSNKKRTHKLLYYAIDFCLLSFNDQPLASSQDLHPLEIALRWWLTQVGRCLIWNPMFPRWTRQQLLGNALTGQKGKANTRKIKKVDSYFLRIDSSNLMIFQKEVGKEEQATNQSLNK